ncbi:hypothetical protein DTO271D3_1504 [Paecilomyces variotii]|nr:hypothetical protein DTO217A2_3220 [Paecilomyces variotii]KAJ9318247.1 hypothetical protein DTO271D3_1504 [Paecilomyces variotii]
MLPTVARMPQLQPHNHLDHRIYDILNTPYNPNDAAMRPSLSQHDPPKHSYQFVARPRVQLPHPVQRSDSHDVVNNSNVSRLTNSGEHALRRKTPNGTLAAGYDGTPGDRAVQPPATKHILVSSLESGHLLTGLPADNWQPMSTDQSSSAQHMSFPPSYKHDSNGLRDDGLQRATGATWVRSVNYVPGVDSMLHQTLPVQTSQRYYLQNGPSVPTVHPAPLQTCLGPTASAGSGPYGPYWPDGAYIPYRPAALRDTRFHQTGQFPTQAGLSGPHFYDLHQPSFNTTPLPGGNLSNPGFAWNQFPVGVNPEPVLQSTHPARRSHQKSFDTFHDPHTNLSTHPTSSNNTLPWSATQPDLSFRTSVADVKSRAGNAEFKEKVLTWAHGVYVDLLATLHQARRNSASKAGIDGYAHRLSRPSIYPKPPRQPGLDFSAQPSAGELSRHNSYPSSQFDLHGRSQHGLGSRHMDGLHSAHGFDDRQTSRPLLSQMHHRNSDSHGISGYHPFRRLSGAAVSPFATGFRNENSTVSSAVSALEMLSHLCMESGWEWVDGMLLGGCLAYGLGDYQKAMRWYSRIIARDATHVEAISNLAATLLALDRREEALQHWFRAVKLRPGYFEAVEHLIGLLCSNHRGKEAVSIIEYVESSLRVSKNGDYFQTDEHSSGTESDNESRSSTASDLGSSDRAAFDYENDPDQYSNFKHSSSDSNSAGFGSSGYAIPGSDNGRMLALIHAKGNMLYALGDNAGAAAAFEDAILIASGRRRHGIQSLIRKILAAFTDSSRNGYSLPVELYDAKAPVLLYPERALQTAKLIFGPYGNPPGFRYVPDGLARKAAISTTSNSLLSLAKIYQDGMANLSAPGATRAPCGVRDILALYYLSLSLQPSPSTANNVGILLASIQQSGPVRVPRRSAAESQLPEVPGVIPGSGISLALAYYNYGLNLDSRHAHLYTNLGSLLKDIGQLQAAIRMYEQAVQCDNNFDIALANLANAVKDSGRVNDAIGYYKRAVRVNPDFAEAVCGLANALNSVCNWGGRGGISNGHGFRDRWHVDEEGMLRDANGAETGSGWIQRVVQIVDRQLKDGETWGCGLLTPTMVDQLCAQLSLAIGEDRFLSTKRGSLASTLKAWAGQKWEGSRIVRLIERAIRAITWQWYQDKYVYGKEYPLEKYRRPQLPMGLSPPNAPTVLPFHTFTCPLSAKQVRHISQRNGLRISCSTLRSPWLPPTVYRPPAPPNPYLKVGYVSSDFNNHPLAHLMQSVFGFHNPSRVKAYCYATTPSDNSVHRRQIEREAPVFYDASSWPVERLVEQIVNDGIHILVNLNGYTRGARNEVFAARPAPIHMSFMGFAGTLGAEWCDYILADELSIPRETLSPHKRDTRLEDRLVEVDHGEELEDWVYAERIVYTKHTFFCCDHRQSAPDCKDPRLTWEEEQERRWRMRKELFPQLSDDTIIMGNFNQLYKIEPTTFRTWLRILARIPNAVLWLLRFPDLGERNLRETAVAWAGEETASRIIFTDVAPKNTHIARAKICDLFLDTPECNAHTTAADVLWSGTPILTYPRYKYKMCSRMASSILSSALPDSEIGKQAAADLIASSDEDYENKAIRLGLDLHYQLGSQGRATGRLTELRKILFMNRWQANLFDTRRWVNDLEDAYEKVWKKWVNGEDGDIWL